MLCDVNQDLSQKVIIACSSRSLQATGCKDKLLIQILKHLKASAGQSRLKMALGKWKLALTK